ncbi:MAG: DICT sensory domain-containing protein, partial [Ktedonobacterales bacterium]
NVISHAIEERVIADRLHCEVYAGFQRLALLKPQTRRYRALLDTARFVSVFGLNDLSSHSPTADLQHPRLLRFVIDPQVGSGLEWFWFVVVEDARFRTALLAQHVAGNLWAHQQNARSYAGVWTFNDALVREIVAILRQAGRALYYRHAPDDATP